MIDALLLLLDILAMLVLLMWSARREDVDLSSGQSSSGARTGRD